MLLKRIYRKPEGWEAKRDAKGNLLNPPPLDHIAVKHTGTHAEQNFSTQLVEAAVTEGWMTLGQGKLTVHGKPEDLVYKIRRAPGHYCCHCGMKLPDAAAFAAPGATNGMRHVADAHAGKKSPDAGNPAGYCRINHYECVLAAEQHKKFSARAQGRV